MFVIFVVGGGTVGKMEKKRSLHKGARLGVCLKKKKLGVQVLSAFFSGCLKDVVQKRRDWLKIATCQEYIVDVFGP